MKYKKIFMVGLILMTGLLLLISQYSLIRAHGPDPVGTIVIKGTLGTVDAEKGLVTVLDKKGKKYAIKLAEGSAVLICDAYGCHRGRGRNVLNRYLNKYKDPLSAGTPVEVDFDPKTGEVVRLDIHKDPKHMFLDDIERDTEE